MSNNIHGFNYNNTSGKKKTDEYRPIMMRRAQNKSLSSADIRGESAFSFIKSICFPQFKFKSAVFIISCIDLIIYIITLAFGIKRAKGELLPPTSQTLDTFGMKIPYKIYNFELLRLFLYCFLHANFPHLLVNLISQLIIGFVVEHWMGTFKFVILYFLSSIIGGLFSCTFSNSSGVGASVAIFGILGGYFGYNLINWNYLDRVIGAQNKCFNLIFIMMIIFANIFFSMGNPLVDNYGHFGGFISGFFLFFLLATSKEEDDGLWFDFKTWQYLGVLFTSIFIVLLIIIFWFLRTPSPNI